jgi:5-methylcytosine-specific restriction endonuclease McrA
VGDSKRNGGEWTEGRFRGFITSTLRSGFRRWPPKWHCRDKARLGKRKNKSTGREAMHFECANCKKAFPEKQIQVDHIKPIGTCDTWDEFVERLFCEVDNLQVLCKPCHKKKTKIDNQTNRKRAKR